MSTPSAAETIDTLVDPGSFEPWPDAIASNDPLRFSDSRSYSDRLAAAKRDTGSREAVRAGRAAIGELPVALLVSEYGFIGGSIGAATGELIARAFERAQAERLPMVAVTRSGGTRMQEGNFGFLQIAKTLAAVERYRRSGLVYVAYLANPTVGGVMASWGARAQVRFAEPGALIGFAGPRGTEATTGTPLPDGVQNAENLTAHGLVDKVVPMTSLRDRLGPLLRVLHQNPTAPHVTPEPHPNLEPAGTAATDPWTSVVRTREPGRPGSRELLAAVADEPTYLHGDGEGSAADPAVLTLVCRVAGVAVVAIAHDRSAGAHPGTGGYRQARRGIALAGELGLPILTIVDTPGAELSRVSEESGLAHQLAECLTDLLTTESPTLSVLLGQGSGGGALALLGGDVVLASEHAWLAPIAPEAASAILYRGTEHADTLARTQRIGARELRDLGLVDRIVGDPAAAGGLAAAAGSVRADLATLLARPRTQRLTARHERYRRIGDCSLDIVATTEGGRHG